MADTKPAKFQDKLESFLRNNRVFFTIIALLVLVAIVATVVGISLTNSARQRDAASLYELETAVKDWQSSLDATDPQAGDILTTIVDYHFRKGSYPDYRQSFLLGVVYEALKDYKSAAESYQAAAGAKGYLGPISLLKTGLMYEAAGDIDSAITSLTTMVNDYDDVEEPRVLFTLGRLSEQTQDWSSAREWYTKLVDGYSSSDWSKYAQNRLISLDVDGHGAN